ncbi:hypothetical protein [Enterobacter cloacae]
MRNSFKLLAVLVLLIAAALFWFWPYIQMEFAESAHYSEQDQREYDFFTPEVLKKMPRISPKFDFDFSNITGPASHVYAVKFYGTKETSKIEEYLKSKGYKQEQCEAGEICWRGNDPQETVYLDMLNGENTVIVQVVYNFN